MVTAITVVLIAAILTIYLSVLKKNGWIGNAASYQSEPTSEKNASSVSLDNLPLASGKRGLGLEEIGNATPVGELEENCMDPATEAKKIILKQKLAQKLIEAQKSSAVQNASPRCTHYFGYLYSFQKNTQIPDECYSCPELIQCFKEPKNESQRRQKALNAAFLDFPICIK